MIVIGLITAFVLGLSVINFISRDFSILEKIGFSYIIGIGLETLFMFILDVMNIRFTGSILIFVSLICILVLNYKNIKNSKNIIGKIRHFDLKLPKINIKKIKLVWLFFFILTCFLLYGSVSKCLYWPTSAYDNVTSFDLMGKVMGIEGKIYNSLFEVDGVAVRSVGTGADYPPLVAGNFAFAYSFGSATSKIMSALLFVFFVIAFYSLLVKYINKTSSMIFTFFMIIAPEMFAFTSLSTSNIPFMIYTASAIITLFIWFDKKEKKYLFISSILMFFSTWARGEGIAFFGVAFVMLLFDSIKNKNWKELLIYSSIVLFSIISWNLYLKFTIEITQNRFITHLFWDYSKFLKILTGVKTLITNTNLYGISFYMFFLVFLLNIKNLFKDKIHLVIMILLSLSAYSSLFYQIDNEVQRASIESLMMSSYKRGLFTFIPLIWFYISMTKITNFVFGRLED